MIVMIDLMTYDNDSPMIVMSVNDNDNGDDDAMKMTAIIKL